MTAAVESKGAQRPTENCRKSVLQNFNSPSSGDAEVSQKQHDTEGSEIAQIPSHNRNQASQSFGTSAMATASSKSSQRRKKAPFPNPSLSTATPKNTLSDLNPLRLKIEELARNIPRNRPERSAAQKIHSAGNSKGVDHSDKKPTCSSANSRPPNPTQKSTTTTNSRKPLHSKNTHNQKLASDVSCSGSGTVKDSQNSAPRSEKQRDGSENKQQSPKKKGKKQDGRRQNSTSPNEKKASAVCSYPSAHKDCKCMMCYGMVLDSIFVGASEMDQSTLEFKRPSSTREETSRQKNTSRKPNKHKSKSKKKQSQTNESIQISQHDTGFFSDSAERIPATEFPVLAPAHQSPVRTSRSKIPIYAEVASRGVEKAVRKSVTPANSPQKAWDEDEQRAWAKANLSAATLEKFVSLYSSPGKEGSSSDGTGHEATKDDTGDLTDPAWHYFSMLPAELQTMIWRHAIRKRETTIHVSYRPSPCGKVPGSIKYHPSKFDMRNVNYETRQLVKELVPFRFGTASSSATVPFDFKRNRLFIHNTASALLLPSLKAMKESDRHMLRYIRIPLRDYVASAAMTVFALCHCPNLLKVWFVYGTSTEDQNFFATHYKDEQTLRKQISRRINGQWKQLWKDWALLDASIAWVVDKVPKVDFDTIDALQAAEYKIDGLQWC